MREASSGVGSGGMRPRGAAAEMQRRLVLALERFEQASDRSSRALIALTVVLVVLTVVIAGLTVAMVFEWPARAR